MKLEEKLNQGWKKYLKEAIEVPQKTGPVGPARPAADENWWRGDLEDAFIKIREIYNATAGWKLDPEHLKATGGAKRAPSEKQKEFLEIFKTNSKMFIHDMEENLGMTPSDPDPYGDFRDREGRDPTEEEAFQLDSISKALTHAKGEGK
jgi:hypothetical protein